MKPLFLKCFTSKEAEELKAIGFSFFKEEYDEYIFYNDSDIKFSENSINVEFFSNINC